ncbi:MAG: hypothetical protein QOD06_3401 [Candidatus Binatota bacterium]|nr:hypothetical protein [Candidatus Binatota bacterium]
MSACLLALDAGTGSGRAAVFDSGGALLACVAREWTYERTDFPGDLAPGHRFDPDVFWGALCDVTRAALERARVAPADVAGVAATSQREGCVFLDRAGRELLAAPNFDARGALEGVEIAERIGLERAYRITGHTPPLIFPLARYLWWRKRFPAEPIAGVLMISDWVTWKLTGERVAEPTNAGESMLYDLERGDWSDEILAAFDIPREVLPRLVTPGDLAGHVRPAAARQMGLLEGTPVYAGGADTQCALLGSGVTAVGSAGAVLGTTAPVQLVSARPFVDLDRYLWAGAHVLPGRFVLESNAGDGGKAYRWLLELLGVSAETAGTYERIAAEAAAADPDGAVFSYFGPSIFNLRTLNPGKPAGILFPYPFGRPRPGRAELLLGFLESLAFAVRANLEQIEAVAGSAIDGVTLSGGMTQTPLVGRLVAQVTERSVSVAAVAESASLGCAVLAAAGSGLHADVAAAERAMVRQVELPRSDPGRYPERYRKWRELYDVLERTNV